MRNAVSERVAECGRESGLLALSGAGPVALYLFTLAPGSQRTMRKSLDMVADIALTGANANNFDWCSLDYSRVVRIRAQLAARYAPATCNKCLAAIRGVLRQAVLSEQFSQSEYAKCAAVRAVRGLATSGGRCISQNELNSMMLACIRGSALGARDAAMIALLYGCGLRRSELVGLRLDDYDQSDRSLSVLGKGQKLRVVFVSSMVLPLLERWLQIRGWASGPLFLRITQVDRVVLKRLSSQAVYRLTARVARIAGVARPSPHDFRRSFVSDLLDRGADLSSVQKLAGHADANTTCRYDRRTDAAQRRAVELLHFGAIEE